jgi:hypothetical protein
MVCASAITYRFDSASRCKGPHIGSGRDIRSRRPKSTPANRFTKIRQSSDFHQRARVAELGRIFGRPERHPKKQTVGKVANAMLFRYISSANVKGTTAFAKYWKPRKDRKTCASWLLVKISRATRNTSPPQPEYQRDVEQIVAQLKSLPPSERAWTQIFLRVTSFSGLENFISAETCIAGLKEIGPAEIVRFLKRERVTDDPDLWFDNLDRSDNSIYSWMAHFILRRTKILLRIEDAPALLACEEFQRNTNSKTHLGTSPYWSMAAAELISQRDLAAANQTIAAGLKRFPLTGTLGGRYQAVLIGSLWRINGPKKKQQIVDWFYRAQDKVTRERSDASNHGPLDLMRLVRDSGRKDIKELMAAIVGDPRFE